MARRQTAARRYAEAAFELALRDETVATWRSELEAASALLADEQLVKVLASPAISLEDRTRVLDYVLDAKVGRLVANLVRLLLRRGRIEELSRVAAEFRRLDNDRENIIPAAATSASELTPDEVRALTGRLEQLSGGRIDLEVSVDPDILGGLIVRVGDRLIDGSVRGRLERLRHQLVSGAL